MNSDRGERAAKTHGQTPQIALNARLVGRPAPDIELRPSPESWTSLALLGRRHALVVFFFAGIDHGTANESERIGRDEQRAREWARHDSELAQMNHHIIGISAQSVTEQALFAGRDPIPYHLLSDPDLDLAALLDLPTTGADWAPVYQPLALVIRRQLITRVFYPVEAASEAASVTRWIRRNTGS
jgi:peroxiredoxin